MSPQQAVDSRTDRNERGLSETPILWIPFLCIQSDRPTRVGEEVSWKGTSLELWFPYCLSRFVTGEARRTFRLRRTYAVRTQDGVSRRDIRKKLVFHFNSGCLVDFLEYLAGLAVCSVSPDSRIVRESPPIHAETPSNGSLRKSESHRQSHSKLRPHQMSQTGGWVRSSV